MRISLDIDNHSVRDSSTMSLEAALLADAIRGIGKSFGIFSKLKREWHLKSLKYT